MPGATSSALPRENGRARQTSGTRPCGNYRRALCVTSPRGQYSGKIRFIEKLVVQDERSRHVPKCRSVPRQAYSEVKLQGRDIVRVLGFFAPFDSLGVGTRGKFVSSSPRGEMGTGQLCQMPLATVRNG